jgi:hypothetical protein
MTIVFFEGAMLGYGLSLWGDNRVKAAAMVAISVSVLFYLIWIYYRTSGLLHQFKASIPAGKKRESKQ